MIKLAGILLVLFSIFLTNDLLGQQTDSVITKSPYGGIMINQNLSLLGFYEANLSKKLLFVGRAGAHFSYDTNSGFRINPAGRVSVRWLFGKEKHEPGIYNTGWYGELALRAIYYTGFERRLILQPFALAGYRRRWKRVILEVSGGLGPKHIFTLPPNRVATIGVNFNAGFGYVLFSKKESR